MLRGYLRLVLFTAGLLLGVQVPGFISDYGKRVEAHLMEARQGLQGYNDTAQRFFNGDLQALVQHYRSSNDPVFRSDADSIAALVNRVQSLDREWQAMQTPWYVRAWHVAAEADPAIRRETWNGYTWQVLLSPDVIAWGIVSALLLALVIETLVVLIGLTLGFGRRPRVNREWR